MLRRYISSAALPLIAAFGCSAEGGPTAREIETVGQGLVNSPAAPDISYSGTDPKDVTAPEGEEPDFGEASGARSSRSTSPPDPPAKP